MGYGKTSSKREVYTNTILYQAKPKVSRRKEIIKIRAEINEIETKQLQRPMKLKAGSLKR